LLHAFSVSMTETDHEPQDSGSCVADESKCIYVIISTHMGKIVAPNPPGEYYNNYKSVANHVLNMNLMPPFSFCIRENPYHYRPNHSTAYLQLYPSHPGIGGRRAVAREASRPTRGVHKKTVCVDQS
jgi:hypothetical protein